jgi:hypothetical protein
MNSILTSCMEDFDDVENSLHLRRGAAFSVVALHPSMPPPLTFARLPVPLLSGDMSRIF